MVSSILSLVLLATAVSAHPQRHHRWHAHGTGTGGVAAPTGGAFSINGTSQTNGTDLGGSAIESPTTAAKTVTVSPIPLESSIDAASSPFSSVPVAIAAVSNTAVAPASESTSSSSCSTSFTSTITTTTVEFVTVTATPDASAVTDDTPKVAAIPSSSSTTSAESGGLEDLSGSSTSISFVSGTATAAAFYGRPSNGGGYSFSDSVASSAAAGVSSLLSVIPTTFATVSGSASASGAASATMASSSSTASSTPSTGGSTSGKKGLSYNTASLTDAFAGQGISWTYNWGASPDGTPLSGTEFVPLFWGANSVSGWSSAVQSAISSGSQHVLSINEPDLSSQANLDPVTAAKLHIANVAPLSGQVSVGSPAVTNGAGSSPPMGTTWLQQFFDACDGQCNIDFVAFHWYSDASQTDYFKQHVQDVIDTAAQNGVSKVWLTEFGASGSDSDVAAFLSDVVPWLDSQAAVERYAYFMCSDGILVNGNSISSPIGEAYVS
ncbi:hypothetical protein LTR46_008984 [Exophiala xenobiotica]|nr:hypothetical protein LTR46_008984 [Exophiala xenobiotica]